MLLRCPKCKSEFVQFLREPQTTNECRKCGAKIPLDALARFEFTCPVCKKESYGRTNVEDAEINLNHCSTPDEFKAEVIEGVSRFAFKAFTKPLRKEHLDGINKLLDTKFTPEDMEYIYTNLGNGINHELCMKFVKSGYDLKVIEESV